MSEAIRVGIIGDFNLDSRSHKATNDALDHAAEYLAIPMEACWLPTASLLSRGGQRALEECDGLWAASGSPYESLEGALQAIRFARERDGPFVGT